ncbi:MAG: hypothetical protein F4X07_05155 [Acidimicrobiaceae bacterium]|nr:hypothetical protein [Acidimicrobiaceae bacterium]
MLCCLLALCVVTSATLATSPLLAHEEGSDSSDQNLVVLNGGGFGHGVGLSQFGAYGRAVDGHTYDQILSFYYDNTTLEPITNFSEFDPTHVPENVEVRVGVRELIAISTPLDELGPGEWELSVEVGGEVIGVSHLPLTTHYDGTRWHAEYTDKSIGVTTDLCDNDPRCEYTVLEVAHTVGTRAVVEEFEDGPNLGSYFGGRYFLHPSSVAIDGVTPDDCGSGVQFCMTHSRPRPYQPGSLNVLIGVRELIAISTPLDELGPGEWELTVEVDDEVIGVSHLPLTTHYDGTRWHAEYTDKSIGVTTDLCDNDARCHNTALEVVQTIGIRATVEEYEDGDNLGTYAGARYLLHPAGVPIAGSNPDRCGTGLKFCVVVAQLDVEKYLYGLQEVPVDWPMEAMKAQAVAARSYAAATVVDRAMSSDWVDEPFNLYDSIVDQVFTGWARESGCDWHAWCDAVDATAGEVVVYQAEVESDEETGSGPSTESGNGEGQTGGETNNGASPTQYEPRIAQAFYSSSNGGHTAKPSDIWTDGIDLPFLLSKPDPYDAAFDPQTGRERNAYATWTRSYSIADLTRWLNNYTVRGESPLNISSLIGLEITEAPESGYTEFATITVHDVGRTVTLTRDGEPYGAWLYFAILNGCRTAQGCHPPVGTKFVIEWPAEFALEPHEDPKPPDPPEEPQEPENPQEPPPVVEFSDISPDDYFYEPVLWSVGEQIAEGSTAEMFGPDDQINRAEFAEILWRFEGSPLPTNRAGFEDVAEDASYRYAVDLLAEYDVTTGTSSTTFSPNMTLSRAQASTFLWRFAGTPAPNYDQTFDDVKEGSYYSEAVRWMLEYGITTGTSPTTFSPDAPLTRAEVVTFIWRLAGLPEAFAPWVQPVLPPKMRIQPNL